MGGDNAPNDEQPLGMQSRPMLAEMLRLLSQMHWKLVTSHLFSLILSRKQGMAHSGMALMASFSSSATARAARETMTEAREKRILEALV